MCSRFCVIAVSFISSWDILFPGIHAVVSFSVTRFMGTIDDVVFFLDLNFTLSALISTVVFFFSLLAASAANRWKC